MEAKMFCANCKEDQEFVVRVEEESYPVKGEETTIHANVAYCTVCGEQIWNQELDDENLKTAYRVFRDKHELLQPEEIKSIREKYAITQVDFARILGLGDKTVARYESGSLQDSAPNNLIFLARYPDAFRLLVMKNKEKISETCYNETMKSLSTYEVKSISQGQKITYSMTSSDIYDIANSGKFYGGIFHVCAG